MGGIGNRRGKNGESGFGDVEDGGEEIRSYRDLAVWQKGMALAAVCDRITKTFPKAKVDGMISQIRKAAVSSLANIAEGHGREYRNELVHVSADGSGLSKGTQNASATGFAS